MRIPSRFSGNQVSLHGLVTADDILYGTAEYMVHTGLAVNRRRAFIKRKNICGRSIIESFSENLMVIPVRQHLRFNRVAGEACGIFGKFLRHNFI